MVALDLIAAFRRKVLRRVEITRGRMRGAYHHTAADYVGVDADHDDGSAIGTNAVIDDGVTLNGGGKD